MTMPAAACQIRRRTSEKNHDRVVAGVGNSSQGAPALYIGSRTTRPYVRVRDAVRTISPGSGQASDGSPIGPYRWYWEKDSINV